VPYYRRILPAFNKFRVVMTPLHSYPSPEPFMDSDFCVKAMREDGNITLEYI